MPKQALTPSGGPWQALANDSAAVIVSRLAQLPWQWCYAPGQAHDETRLMFTEKQAAWLETQWAIAQMPWHFWMDAWGGDLILNPRKAMQRASARAQRRLSSPMHKRVRANQRRLSGRR